MTLFKSLPRVRIALGEDCLVAVVRRGKRLETTAVADLALAFVELKRTTGLLRAAVTVALLPPLVEVRMLSLPPLRSDERRRILTRDAARYFVGADEPQVVGSEAIRSRHGMYLVAAAPAKVLEALEAAVHGVGWTLRSVIPAHAAWATSVRKKPECSVVVRLPHATEVLRIAGGLLIDRRRVPPREPLPDGAIVLAPPDSDPLAIAAEYAHAIGPCELCSERTHGVRQALTRRVAVVLAGGVMACLLMSAGIDYWGLQRQLVAVRARRAALAPRVAIAMSARDSLESIVGNIGALHAMEATSPQWTAFLTDLADFLPHDTHVVTFRGASDSAVIEGIAKQAAGAFQAVQQIPRVAGVRAVAPIREDATADGTVQEHFALGAVLRTPAAPAGGSRAP